MSKFVGKVQQIQQFFKKNLNNGDFVNVSGEVKIEIISIGTTIKGKVKGESLSENCSVNGIFEVPFCQ